MKIKIFLGLIIFLGFMLRIYMLSSNPPHLNWDEVSLGYNAYSILKTAKDEWGQSLPIIFRAYGDYKLPVYVYTAVPFIGLFGLNELSVRLVSVIAGTVTILFTFLLVRLILKRDTTALISALLIAVSPWDLFLSRIALEANLALTLIISGIYFLLRKNYLVASILLGLSVWTYNSARVFVPLFILTYTFLFRKEVFGSFKKVRLGIVILVVFLLPMLWQLVNQAGSARYENVKIIDEGAISQIIENRSQSKYNNVITRLIYNRPVYFAKEFIENYLSHYSLSFLFKEGGNHYQFNLPNHGLLYEIDFIFIVFGITYICFKRNNLVYLLVGWFFIAPIPSSLTREAPHALRDIVFLPIPMILTAVGLNFVLENFRNYRYIFASLYFALITLMMVNYLNSYFTSYANEYSWAWQYGYEETVSYIAENYDKYDKIIFTKKYGEPHEFLLFYGNKLGEDWALPQKYQKDTNLIRFYQSNWYWVDGIDKFYFVNDWEIPKKNEVPFVLESETPINLSGKILFVTSPDNYPPRFIKLKEIYFLDGSKAFDIVTADL